MEMLDVVIQWIVGIVGGLSISAIISAIIYGLVKGIAKKIVAKINVEKISEKATERGIEKIKKISFEQSIQPVVESELKKITEQANEYIKKEIGVLQNQYNALLETLEKFYAFFDDSMVSEKKKNELKQSIEEAKLLLNVSAELQKIIVLEETNENKSETTPKETKEVLESKVTR